MTDHELYEEYKKNKERELAQNIALKNQQQQLLDNNLKSRQNAIAKQQNAAEQNASISNELLMKYLNKSQASSGLASGQRNSAYINANNNYLNNRATIANNAAEQQEALLREYQNSALTNEQQAYNNEKEIYDRYRNYALQDKELQMQEADMLKNHELLDTNIENNKLNIEQSKKEWQNAASDKEDLHWFDAALRTLNKKAEEIRGNDTKLTNAAKERLKAYLEDEYKDKFINSSYYDKLMDMLEHDTWNEYLYEQELSLYN